MTQLTTRRLLLGALIMIGGLAIASLIRVEAWDGGFPQAEFRVRFIDARGAPCKGISLMVKDAAGRPAYCYPVTDYHQECVPMSGDDGILVFHHVNLSPEFSGKVRYLFFALPIGQRSPPTYYCQFARSGEIVYEVPFNDYFGYSGRSPKEWAELAISKKEAMDNCFYCPSTELSDHLKMQHRSREKELVFPIVESVIQVK
jgi:hypothetical protein